MSSCENLERCPVFEKFNSGGLAEIWIINYCKGKHDKCKRKEMKSKGEQVPPNMLPNGTLLKSAN